MIRSVQQHQADLEYYCGVGYTRFNHSPSGAILERQWASYVNPVQGNRGDFNPWACMHVKAQAPEPFHEPELADLHRFGHVSSALYKLEKENWRYVSALLAYYGDRGGRWSLERGEGRLLSIYPLTATGQKWVTAMLQRSDVPLHLLREDERLATECLQQERNPTDIRKQRLNRIEEEARALHRDALRAYMELAA